MLPKRLSPAHPAGHDVAGLTSIGVVLHEERLERRWSEPDITGQVTARANTNCLMKDHVPILVQKYAA